MRIDAAIARKDDEQRGNQNHRPALDSERVGCQPVDHPLDEFEVLDLGFHPHLLRRRAFSPTRRAECTRRAALLGTGPAEGSSSTGDLSAESSEAGQRGVDFTTMSGGWLV